MKSKHYEPTHMYVSFWFRTTYCSMNDVVLAKDKISSVKRGISSKGAIKNVQY